MSNWTLVTGYFPIEGNRNPEFYLEQCKSTLELDIEMVIYIDTDLLEKVKKIRTHPKTVFIPMKKEQFDTYKYKDQVISNRKKIKTVDERNKPDTFLLCSSKFQMVRDVIKSNPFESTYFAWIDFAAGQQGGLDQSIIDWIISENRYKISCVAIDYHPAQEVKDIDKWYEGGIGKCYLGCRFITGGKGYWIELYEHVKHEIRYIVNIGYGHQDEQILSRIYVSNPSLFELYYGDYKSTFDNYVRCTTKEYATVNLYIPKCVKDENYDEAIRAIKFLQHNI